MARVPRPRSRCDTRRARLVRIAIRCLREPGRLVIVNFSAGYISDPNAQENLLPIQTRIAMSRRRRARQTPRPSAQERERRVEARGHGKRCRLDAVELTTAVRFCKKDARPVLTAARCARHGDVHFPVLREQGLRDPEKRVKQVLVRPHGEAPDGAHAGVGEVPHHAVEPLKNPPGPAPEVAPGSAPPPPPPPRAFAARPRGRSPPPTTPWRLFLSASPSSTSTPKRTAAPEASQGLLDVAQVGVRRARDARSVERGGQDVRALAVEQGAEREREGQVPSPTSKTRWPLW